MLYSYGNLIDKSIFKNIVQILKNKNIIPQPKRFARKQQKFWEALHFKFDMNYSFLFVHLNVITFHVFHLLERTNKTFATKFA